MAELSWIEERERRHLLAMPGQWGWEDDDNERRLVRTDLRPAYRAFNAQWPRDWSEAPPSGLVAVGGGGAGSQYEDIEIKPEDQSFIANTRNEEPRILAILKAAAALVEVLDEDGPHDDTRDMTCRVCDVKLAHGHHRPDCAWKALVAALRGEEG